MAVMGHPFFSGQSLWSFLYARLERASKSVGEVPDTVFDAKSDDEIADEVRPDVGVKQIALDLSSAKPSITEAHFVQHGQFGDTIVDGFRVEKTILFSGYADLWNLQPSSFDMSPPCGEIDCDSVVIGAEVSSGQIEQAKSHVKAQIGKIEIYLANQKALIDAHNAKVEGDIREAIATRRARRGQMKAALADF